MRSITHPVPARERAQLTASGLTVLRGDRLILDRLDLTVHATSRIAIVGENGRGKSTLLHALAGQLPPDDGAVQRIGTVGVAEQELDVADRRTVGDLVAEALAAPREALARLDTAGIALAAGEEHAAEDYATALADAESLDAWDAERRLQIALEALDAAGDPSRPVAELSVGQRYRVRLACLLGGEDDFLLLDEPTNHLDAEALDFLTARLRERAGGVVLVSHDRALLADVADTIVDLDPSADGRPRVYGNGFAGYREGRAAEREQWEQRFAREQAERTRLQEDLSAAQNRLVSGWRPEKGSPKHGRATRAGGLVQSVHRRTAALEAHAVTVPEPPQVLRFPDLPVPAGVVLLDVDGVSVSERLREPVSFVLRRESRLVVTGPNGAGKSTLLQVCAGAIDPDTGTVSTGARATIGYLGQESALPGDPRASDAFRAHLDRLVAGGRLREAEAIGLAGLGLLRASERRQRIADLSMGQRRRLDLALVLAARPQVLLLDEPTNHLSITLVDELTEALAATPAAVVLATHDRQLLRDTDGWPRLEL